MVEHNLAKVGVEGSSPFICSNASGSLLVGNGFRKSVAAGSIPVTSSAGWSSLVARKAHNLEVVGSNPTHRIYRKEIAMSSKERQQANKLRVRFSKHFNLAPSEVEIAEYPWDIIVFAPNHPKLPEWSVGDNS